MAFEQLGGEHAGEVNFGTAIKDAKGFIEKSRTERTPHAPVPLWARHLVVSTYGTVVSDMAIAVLTEESKEIK